MFEQIDPTQKTIIFCVDERHALLIRDIVNEQKTNPHTDYCVRVTSSEGKIGDEFLRQFRDNEKTIPTILTTSQKLSTGVDARNVRFIVLMRSVGSMVEFKQIIGRGTRVFEGKDFFTIVDFNDNIQHFSDPAWDGEPLDDIEIDEPGTPGDGGGEVNEPEPPYGPGGTTEGPGEGPDEGGDGGGETPKKLEIKLADGKIRKINHTVETIYFGPDGKAMSAREFLENVFGTLPQYFATEKELQKIWSNPKTRARLMEELAASGFDEDKLAALKKIIDAENSDMYDVLRYVAFAKEALSRQFRVDNMKAGYFSELSEDEEVFVRFVLEKYGKEGERELSEQNLPSLLRLKYHSTHDAVQKLGKPEVIKRDYYELQRELYEVELT
jgi:type I restriction enzyme R subunit